MKKVSLILAQILERAHLPGACLLARPFLAFRQTALGPLLTFAKTLLK